MAKTISLRDANQSFAKLVREVEEKGTEVTVTRRGQPIVKIVPLHRPGALSAEKRAAFDRIFDKATLGRSPRGWQFDKKELYDEALGFKESGKPFRHQTSSRKRPSRG